MAATSSGVNGFQLRYRNRPIFNHRADNHFGIWVELLDRMTNQVRAGVADNFHAFFVFRRNDLTWASSVIGSQASTNLPLTLPATVAFAKPAPIDAAICATVTGDSYWRTEPSGKVMFKHQKAPKH